MQKPEQMKRSLRQEAAPGNCWELRAKSRVKNAKWQILSGATKSKQFQVLRKPSLSLLQLAVDTVHWTVMVGIPCNFSGKDVMHARNAH